MQACRPKPKGGTLDKDHTSIRLSSPVINLTCPCRVEAKYWRMEGREDRCSHRSAVKRDVAGCEARVCSASECKLHLRRLFRLNDQCLPPDRDHLLDRSLLSSQDVMGVNRHWHEANIIKSAV